jgi:hypothetical protein
MLGLDRTAPLAGSAEGNDEAVRDGPFHVRKLVLVDVPVKRVRRVGGDEVGMEAEDAGSSLELKLGGLTVI